MTGRFVIPADVLKHRVMHTEPMKPAPDVATITWRGLTAVWSRAEQESVRGLPASELAVIQELKSRLDAVLA